MAFRAFPSLGGVGTPADPTNREGDRREIIRVYETARAAHFSHDSPAFLGNYDTSWNLVADGTVALRTVVAETPRIQEYFDSIAFASVTDIDPPHVEVSSDGTMAWLLGHVRVRGIRKEGKGSKIPLAFDAAWIDVWQKRDGKWRIVAHANTQRDDTIGQ